MANNWGCTLVFDRSFRGSKRSSEAMESMGDNSLTIFADVVRKDLGSAFLLEKVTPNGSDANLYAVNVLTNGDNNGCLIASGSYVAGDGGPLAPWTSSTFDLERGPSFVAHPEDVASEFTKQHTAALPYYIPGAMTESELQQYEDKCMDHLHIRCLVHKMKGVKITALLMEITLANNGATLSDRACTRIGLLARHHGFRLIVDEIMTGGRTGTMLQCMTKPAAFVDAIDCVTMGKWLGMGLVLVSPAYREESNEKFAKLMRRGVSTNMTCTPALKLWRAAMFRMKNTASRRAAALHKLGVQPEAAWGDGLHIFAPLCRQSASRSSRLRFLPLLEQTPFDSIKMIRNGHIWTKVDVNKQVVEGCEEWLTLPYYLHTEEDESYHKLVASLVCSGRYSAKVLLSTEQVIEEIFGSEKFNVKSAGVVLRVAEDAGLVVKRQVTQKRHRMWEIQALVDRPW